MLVAFAGFGYLAARKLAILRHLQPEPRWDHPASRLKSRAGQRLPAVAHDPRRVEARRDARGRSSRAS